MAEPTFEVKPGWASTSDSNRRASHRTPVEPHVAPKRPASGTGRPKPPFRKRRAAADADRGGLRRSPPDSGRSPPDGTSVPAAPTIRRLPPREAGRCGGRTAAPVRRNPAAITGNAHYGMCGRRRCDKNDRHARETPVTPQDRYRASHIDRRVRTTHPAAVRTGHPQVPCGVRDIPHQSLNHIPLPMKTQTGNCRAAGRSDARPAYLQDRLRRTGMEPLVPVAGIEPAAS